LAEILPPVLVSVGAQRGPGRGEAALAAVEQDPAVIARRRSVWPMPPRSIFSVLPDSMVTGVSKRSVPGALLPGDRMPASRVGAAMSPVPLRMPLELTVSEGAEITLFAARVPRSTVMGGPRATPRRSAPPCRGRRWSGLPVLLLCRRPAKVLVPFGTQRGRPEQIGRHVGVEGVTDIPGTLEGEFGRHMGEESAIGDIADEAVFSSS